MIKNSLIKTMIVMGLITGVSSAAPCFASTLPNTQATSSSSASASTYSTGTVYDVNTYLNVRSGASKSYSVIGKLKNNQQVTITGESGNWYQINYNGSTAYVSKDYVTSGSSSSSSSSSSNSSSTTTTTTTSTTTTTTTTSSSSSSSYLKTLTMNATAYTATGNKTATGVWPSRNASGISTVAVDPNVIPLGSKLYIEGYGYAVAADTGGAISGNKIDLYMNSNSECINFGRQNVTVHIVAYPGQW